ncbi:MAG: aldehyde dehydrogenase family protein [Phycisphaerales bacterium]|nr:MAG: aldehyde dehydrogenase family protein [Phycisphaerales bacterium]
MTDRLAVQKTYKLFINGAFPRSESGRTFTVKHADGSLHAHASHASRKDLRAAVEAARSAQRKWDASPAVLRGQILYRAAEMLEGRRDEFAALLRVVDGLDAEDAEREVSASIDRLVAFAGWADKFQQVLGSHNPVAGPYDNFTMPEATGVVAIFAPEAPSLLGLVSLIAPAICAGNAVVAIAGARSPGVAIALAEVCATSDVPAGVINILTGDPGELIPWAAGHRDVDAITAAGVDDAQASALREGAGENLKRVTIHERPDRDAWFEASCEGPEWIAASIEFKTAWHPSAV